MTSREYMSYFPYMEKRCDYKSVRLQEDHFIGSTRCIANSFYKAFYMTVNIDDNG